MDSRFVQYPVINGVYQHYKGGLYEVMTLGKHSETDETLVIYKSLLFGSIHVRPLDMWFDIIKTDEFPSKDVTRFRLIKVNEK